MAGAIPSHARVVIIGGGIVGCSVAYHFAKLGWSDVVLLERKQLGSGTSWHAAGLVGQLRATYNLTQLACYGAKLYGELEEETGQATGYSRRGSVAVARTEGRLEEFRRQVSMAKCFGVDVEIISPEEAGRIWPPMRTDDLVGAIWIPGDGQTNPIDTAVAMAKGARQGGATILEGVKVTGVRHTNGAVTAVATSEGDIAAEFVVNCGGMWGREIGRMCGVDVPLQAAEHFYIVTQPMDCMMPGMPSMRDYDGRLYFKEDAGKLLMGGFEAVAKPWGMDGIPEGFEFEQLNEDWDHFEPLMENGLHRVPPLADAAIRQLLVGPESFTPDNRYMLGEAPGLRNFYIAAGFNSVGIASAAGAGKAVAEWIVGGEPPMDLWDVDIRRVFPFQNNARYLHDRTVEALGLLYDMHWPFRQPRVRTWCAPVARSRQDRRGGRLFRRRGRLGATELVCATRDRSRLRLRLRPSELVRILRRGAQRGAQCRRPVRSDLVRQIRPSGSGRRSRHPDHRGRRHGGAARPGGLHTDAQ